MASFDGTVVVHSLTERSGIDGGGEGQAGGAATAAASKHNPDYNPDPFGQHSGGFPSSPDVHKQSQAIPPDPCFALQKAPKWLTRPVSAAWGWGGQLVTVRRDKPGSVEVSTVSLEFGDRASRLYHATITGSASISEYCSWIAQSGLDGVTTSTDKQTWNVLGNLVGGGRSDLVASLGYDASAPAGTLTPVLETLVKDSEAKMVKRSGVSGAFHLFKRASSSAGGSIAPSKADSQVDTIITRALILGDFDTAVQACLASDRLSDALAIAASSPDPNLLDQTRASYFERVSGARPYIRLLGGIVATSLPGGTSDEQSDGGIGGIVDSCILESAEETWKDLLCLLCTYGGSDDAKFRAEVARLAARLDQREYVPGTFASPGKASDELDRRTASMLCHLLAGDLDTVLSVWSEAPGLDGKLGKTRHLAALQSLVERVLVFTHALGVSAPADPGPEFVLTKLYDGYREYAVLLAQHGLIDFAWRILQLVPYDYHKDLEMVDGLPQWPELCDRVYHSPLLSTKGTYDQTPPVFPFSVQDIAQALPQVDSQYGYGGSQQQQQQGGYGTSQQMPAAQSYHQPGQSQQYNQPSQYSQPGQYQGYDQQGQSQQYNQSYQQSGYQQASPYRRSSSSTGNLPGQPQQPSYGSYGSGPYSNSGGSQSQYIQPSSSSAYSQPQGYQQPQPGGYGGGYGGQSAYGRSMQPPAAAALPPPPPTDAAPPTPAFAHSGMSCGDFV